MRTLFGLASTAAILGGCGSSTLDDDEEHVRTWANNGSPVAVWSHAHDVIAFADGGGSFMDPMCPVTSDDGTTVTVTGGCTASDGVAWEGSATVVRSAGGVRTATFTELAKINDPDLVVHLSGTFEVREVSPGTHSFTADLVAEGGATTTIDYQGTVAGDYDTATTWNGSGTIERDGALEPTGRVTVTTVDQFWDDGVCAGQASSGQTTIEGDDHTVVVTYDGATDCDADEAAEWSYDGEDRGKVTGITCAVVAPGAGGSSAAACLAGLLVGLIATARARRRR